MASQNRDVDTVFIHGSAPTYRAIVLRDGKRLFKAKVELKATTAGPRPSKFRVMRGETEEARNPSEFIEIARRVEFIRISEQTDLEDRRELEAMLDGYQLSAEVVRTCRICSAAGRYSPITDGSSITANEGADRLCSDCALDHLDRELKYHHEMTGGARDRLREILLDIRDLDRILNLLAGRLDPELTKFDVISPAVTTVDPVSVDSLPIHPHLQSHLQKRFDTLLPVQSLALENGLSEGEDQLVVSATATGKTLIGEMAGIDGVLSGRGKFVFLVPLVALANQKHTDFVEEYGRMVDVTIRVGASRIRRGSQRFDATADVIVGTYEGIDHALRTGRDLGRIGTVVIDEIHTLQDEDRGHRLDGLIARLKDYCEHQPGSSPTQWIYLSATVGNPHWLAEQLRARLVEYKERPVPIERHVTFADRYDKPTIIDSLVKREFDRESSKGYRGQSIVFTNSRRRCHEISRQLEYSSAAYHAGLEYRKRQSIERSFADGDLSAVVTTAALGAGVDFPASQVIFESLAMGIEWLSTHEFHQMLGRAGRPDYHDRGTVFLLVEPGGKYHRGMDRTEDEIAFTLLKDEMESVEPAYEDAVAVEEMLANFTVGGDRAARISKSMIGDISETDTIDRLMKYGFIQGTTPTSLGRAVTEHFLSPDDTFLLLEGIRAGDDPIDLVASYELRPE